MRMVRKLGCYKKSEMNFAQSWGLFLCSFCGKEVERRLTDGKRNKSCGCSTSRLIGKATRKRCLGTNLSEETKNKIRERSIGRILSQVSNCI